MPKATYASSAFSPSLTAGFGLAQPEVKKDWRMGGFMKLDIFSNIDSLSLTS